MNPPEKAEGPAAHRTQETATTTGRHLNPGDGQWAKVPEWVAYKDLDATAWNVLVILAAKAGRDRVAWISQRTIGDGLGVHRTTVGRAVRKLTKVGVIERGRQGGGQPSRRNVGHAVSDRR